MTPEELPNAGTWRAPVDAQPPQLRREDSGSCTASSHTKAHSFLCPRDPASDSQTPGLQAECDLVQKGPRDFLIRSKVQVRTPDTKLPSEA